MDSAQLAVTWVMRFPRTHPLYRSCSKRRGADRHVVGSCGRKL